MPAFWKRLLYVGSSPGNIWQTNIRCAVFHIHPVMFWIQLFVQIGIHSEDLSAFSPCVFVNRGLSPFVLGLKLQSGLRLHLQKRAGAHRPMVLLWGPDTLRMRGSRLSCLRHSSALLCLLSNDFSFCWTILWGFSVSSVLQLVSVCWKTAAFVLLRKHRCPFSLSVSVYLCP